MILPLGRHSYQQFCVKFPEKYVEIKTQQSKEGLDMGTSAVNGPNNGNRSHEAFAALKRERIFLKALDRGIGFAENTAIVLAYIPLIPFCVAGCSPAKPAGQKEEQLQLPPPEQTVEHETVQSTEVIIEEIPFEEFASWNGTFNTQRPLYFHGELPYIRFYDSRNHIPFGFAVELKEQISGKLSFSYKCEEAEAPVKLQFIHAEDLRDHSTDRVLIEETLYPRKEEQQAVFSIPETTNKIVIVRFGEGPAGIYMDNILVIREVRDKNAL